jgi:hypothetical protein
LTVLIHKKLKELLLIILPALLLVGCSSDNNDDLKPVSALPYTRLSLDDLTTFQQQEAPAWNVAGGVYFSRFDPNRIQKGEGHGVLYVNNRSGKTSVLRTAFKHADMDLDLEFMTGKGSISAIWLQGKYKISLNDSWQIVSPASADCGGSEVAGSDSLGRPLLNACRAPGLWQHLFVSFRAARFDAAGKRVSAAVFTKVVLNGKTVLENFALPALSPGAVETGEKGRAALAFVSSKGALAFRNILYKTYDARNITLTSMRYGLYRGSYTNYDTLKKLIAYKSGKTDTLSWRVGERDAALKFTGDLNIITSGNYLFRLRAGAATALLIDDREVTSNRGARDCATAHSGSIHLSEGKHNFTLFHAGSRDCLVLEYEGPGIPFTPLTTAASDRLLEPPVPVELPVSGVPEMQRGSMMQKDRINYNTVAVGFANGINYSYDMTRFNLMGMWRGKYVANINNNESPLQVPLGANVELDGLPAIFYTDSAPETWPDGVGAGDSMYSERSYRMDSLKVPVYRYTYMGGEVEDRISADKDGLIRRLTYTRPNGAVQSSFLLASGSLIEKLPDGSFGIDNKRYYVQFPDFESAGHAVIMKFKNGRYGLIWKLRADKTTESLTYAFIW